VRGRLSSAVLGAALGGLPAVVVAWLCERENPAFLDQLPSFIEALSLPGALVGAVIGAAVGRGSPRTAGLGLVLALLQVEALNALAHTEPAPRAEPAMLALVVDGLGSGDLAATDLPNLAALASGGASGTLVVDRPLRPATVQAALATGRKVDQFGVHGWTGREEPLAAAGILEIADHEGLVVRADGWPGPAEDAAHLVTLDAIEGEVVAGSRWSTLRDELHAEAQDRLQPLPPLDREIARELTGARRARDRFLQRLRLDPPDLAILHLGSVEALTHLAAGAEATPFHSARQEADEILGELRPWVSAHGWLVVWSGWNVDATGADRPDGLLVIVGPGVPPGKALGEVPARDLAPTLLGLLDLPLGEDMKGKARFGDAEPPVATWDALAPGGPHEGDEAAARSEALRGLGYAE